jgi:phospholipase C
VGVVQLTDIDDKIQNSHVGVNQFLRPARENSLPQNQREAEFLKKFEQIKYTRTTGVEMTQETEKVTIHRRT